MGGVYARGGRGRRVEERFSWIDTLSRLIKSAVLPPLLTIIIIIITLSAAFSVIDVIACCHNNDKVTMTTLSSHVTQFEAELNVTWSRLINQVREMSGGREAGWSRGREAGGVEADYVRGQMTSELRGLQAYVRYASAGRLTVSMLR